MEKESSLGETKGSKELQVSSATCLQASANIQKARGAANVSIGSLNEIQCKHQPLVCNASRKCCVKGGGVRNLVDPASSHMLVSKIKPCMSQYKLLHGETANGSLKQL